MIDVYVVPLARSKDLRKMKTAREMLRIRCRF